MLLDVQDLTVSYGRAKALQGLSFSCDEGEVVSLVGPNGAGKTSAMMAIAGASAGSVGGTVRIAGRAVLGKGAEVIARLGLSLVPEARRAFVDLTVVENLRIGARRLPEVRRRERAVEELFERIPVLAGLCDRPAGKLSGGEQQLLVIARAVIGQPRLLLLDEPSLGLSPVAIRQVYDLIRALVRDHGTALVLVEQNALSALDLADRCIVLRSGRVEMRGVAREMRGNKEFIDAYFGVGHGGEARA